MLKKLQLLKSMGVSAMLISLLSGCYDPSDGSTAQTSTVAAAPAPTSKSAVLTWEAPTVNTNGTPLTDLAGYRIYYGSNATDLSHTVQTSLGLQTYVIENLEAGTWYFAIRAVTSAGTESALSDIVAKTIG